MPLPQQELASSAADLFAVVTGASVRVRQRCLQLVETVMCLGGGLRTILSSQKEIVFLPTRLPK